MELLKKLILISLVLFSLPCTAQDVVKTRALNFCGGDYACFQEQERYYNQNIGLVSLCYELGIKKDICLSCVGVYEDNSRLFFCTRDLLKKYYEH